MIGFISSDELEQLGQILIKQLGKNRYAPSRQNKKFVVGIDLVKMRLFNVENSAQDNLIDNAVFDKSKFNENEVDRSSTGKKFNKSLFDEFIH